MKLIATVAALCASAPSIALASGLVSHVFWSFDEFPDDGLTDINFPIRLDHAPHEEGYFFAQQIEFSNSENRSIVGLQPRPDNDDGESTIHAVFASFQDQTTTEHSNCHYAADGDTGVWCAVDVDHDYGRTYYLVVENSQPGSETWKGSIQEPVTGLNVVIGEWTLPPGTGHITNLENYGFIEYYPWHDRPSPSCDVLPRTEVSFFSPSSKTKGATDGFIAEPFEFGDCIGKEGFAVEEIADGWKVGVGFD
ncbi:hypothetical protein PLIIFM63780_007965 [Purpureocillium lilacinum]|uniref:uncharacterized protein n=1 Tax=Purpureocillium lilacinum TaxID=33203 RepID=UPI00207F6CEF|nr:hypothetical protein PLICBS_007978 [Purpureocillium lilacinum]GJN84409.1 hypothetical protein PLIIFM63780_007965 [Purpureocillium lilacinum]